MAILLEFFFFVVITRACENMVYIYIIWSLEMDDLIHNFTAWKPIESDLKHKKD